MSKINIILLMLISLFFILLSIFLPITYDETDRIKVANDITMLETIKRNMEKDIINNKKSDKKLLKKINNNIYIYENGTIINYNFKYNFSIILTPLNTNNKIIWNCLTIPEKNAPNICKFN